MKIVAKAFLLLVCCLVLALPQWAVAKAGGGRSMGSMGSHTYQSSPVASPVQRSVTPPAAAPFSPSAPSYNPGYAPLGNSHPFLTGLAGGFLGAGLAGMLFGHGWGDSMGMGSSGGLGVLPLLILAAIGYFIFRSMRNRSSSGMSVFGKNFPPLGPGYDASFGAASQPAVGAPAITEAPLTPTPDDYQNFMQLLEKIQLAWGSADMSHLRQYVTPEMLEYFSEELSANVSRGIINHISDVAVTEGTLIQAWSEPDLDYATVHLKWHAVDYMARADRGPNDTDYVVSGDALHPTQAEEIWTFARASGGGHWLLSAIQQVTARINAV